MTWTEFDVDSGKAFIASAITVIDVFLIATVIYLISLGLYMLFLDPEVPLPDWLAMCPTGSPCVTSMTSRPSW